MPLDYRSFSEKKPRHQREYFVTFWLPNEPKMLYRNGGRPSHPGRSRAAGRPRGRGEGCPRLAGELGNGEAPFGLGTLQTIPALQHLPPCLTLHGACFPESFLVVSPPAASGCPAAGRPQTQYPSWRDSSCLVTPSLGGKGSRETGEGPDSSW